MEQTLPEFNGPIARADGKPFHHSPSPKWRKEGEGAELNRCCRSGTRGQEVTWMLELFLNNSSHGPIWAPRFMGDSARANYILYETLHSQANQARILQNQKLAPAPDNLRYASIVGSHTNQAFRAFWCGIAHSDPKLTVLDSAWATSIRDGVPWLVVSHHIAQQFPDYPGLAQAAGNASGQIASVENELQLARKVSTAIADVVKQKPVEPASSGYS